MCTSDAMMWIVVVVLEYFLYRLTAVGFVKRGASISCPFCIPD